MAEDPYAQDIYPLGQGNGLMSDIINFGLNGLYQYGQKAGDYNQRVATTLNSIKGGGSADVGPLVGDIISTSPLAAGTINWGGMTEPAKAMLQKFGVGYPNMLQAVENAPRNLTANITTDLPKNVSGSLRTPNPTTQIMKVHPDYTDAFTTVGHELQHSLNYPRLIKTNPLDALTVATLLRDYLPAGNAASLDTILNKVTMPSPNATIVQRLTGRVPQVVNPANADKNLYRAAMDEALTYLGQNVAQEPYRLFGKLDPLTSTLADRLGVRWR